MHKDVNLAEFAGQEIELTFLLWSGLEGGGVKTTQYHRLSEGWIGYRNKDLEELYYLLVSMVEGIPCLPEESRDRQLLEKLADKTLAFLDWDEDRLAETGKEALAWLNNELDKANEGREEAPCVHAVGHTHIDVSWLWRLKHTREKAQRSFATVLRLMSEFPEYKFLQSQPQLYEFIKKRCAGDLRGDEAAYCGRTLGSRRRHVAGERLQCDQRRKLDKAVPLRHPFYRRGVWKKV